MKALPCASDDHPCRGRSACLSQHERPNLLGGSCCVIDTGHVRARTFVQVLCLIGSDYFVSYGCLLCVCGAANPCDLFPKRSDEEKGA